MLLENRFTVPVPVERAWSVLLDVERIAPCVPGASLDAVTADGFEGGVKVSLGPISMKFKGGAEFVTRDEQAHVAVLRASGKEVGGTGTAKATVTMRLEGLGPNTDVRIDTDLAVTGKAAKFGRGVMADVAGRLVDQFAGRLADQLSAASPALAAGEQPVPATEPSLPITSLIAPVLVRRLAIPLMLVVVAFSLLRRIRPSRNDA